MPPCVLGHILRHLVHFVLNECECVSPLCTIVYAPLSICLLSPTLCHLIQGALGWWVRIPLRPFAHRFPQSSVLGNLAQWLLCSINPPTPPAAPAASLISAS